MLQTRSGVLMTSSAHDLAAATPVDRDRYVDLLRVVALGVVMLGHFFMVGVEIDAGRCRRGDEHRLRSSLGRSG